MEEIVNLMMNNGLGIACVAYLIWFQSTTMKEMLTALGNINDRLTVIETHVGIKDKGSDK